MKQPAGIRMKGKEPIGIHRNLGSLNLVPLICQGAKEYLLITVGVILIMLGAHFFKFPNHFTFGGITGLSVILGEVTSTSPGTVNLYLNMILLILGFLYLGKSFGIKTIYSTLLLSFGLSFLDRIAPVKAPITDEPLLDLIFAIILPAIGSAILFNIGGSGGGTDVIAMIMKKYTSINIGTALFFSDFLISFCAIFIFDMKTFLFSFLGMVTKSLLIDNIIESFNICKYFNVICSDPQPICDFIIKDLNQSATICQAQGAYTHQNKYIVMTALKRSKALKLSRYVKSKEPTAFITITNTSEIIGKGFKGDIL